MSAMTISKSQLAPRLTSGVDKECGSAHSIIEGKVRLEAANRSLRRNRRGTEHFRESLNPEVFEARSRESFWIEIADRSFLLWAESGRELPNWGRWPKSLQRIEYQCRLENSSRISCCGNRWDAGNVQALTWIAFNS